MDGWADLLGSLITSTATPAIGGIAGQAATDVLGDLAEEQLIKELTQTTVGALTGAGIGALTGKLTGGDDAVMQNAIMGALGGGIGGYNAKDVSRMFNFGPQGQPQQPQQRPPQGQMPAQGQAPSTVPGYTPPQQPAIGASTIGNPAALQRATSNLFSPQAIGLNSTQPQAQPQPQAQIPQQVPVAQMPQVPQAPLPQQQGIGSPSYMDFLSKNKELLMGAAMLAMLPKAQKDTQNMYKKYEEAAAAAKKKEKDDARRLAESFWGPSTAPGRAMGGPVDLGLPGAGIQVHIPSWAQEKMQREGGLAGLQAGLDQKLANGGYVNTQPMNPDDYFPMSQIPRAMPYAAASPIRHEVIDDYAHGGLIDGPGDGMSDDIPANISGKEPVRVADGEYVIPKSVAARYGEDALKRMMSQVRSSAHAKKGKQIVQDAGKRAFIRALSGVHA